MASGRDGRGGKPGRDRTKYRATAGRPASIEPRQPRWQVGCGFLIGAFLWVLGTGAGVGLVVHGAFLDLPKQFGYHTSPVLQMKVDACTVTVQGKSRTVDCYGHGDPGSSGVVDEQWMIAGAEHRYAPGTVVPVRCSRTGGCEETGTSEKARDVAEAAFGLLLFGGMATLLASGVRSRLARRRGRGPAAPLPRWTVRSGLAVAAVLGAVGVAAAVVALAT
ncbi:hypothetical protein [Streptacidiphilus monticola]|uniref:DUF3592 domain-containing protein n=1 Tax=Streptacidiphilus monticola TaxID=2161674 RepID=A0ABW1GA34_9ACTN